VAAVPYLVGFLPARSLVLLSLRGERRRFGLVARADLPDTPAAASDVASDVASAVASDVAALTASICGFLLRDRPREVLALVYDEQGWGTAAPPWRDLVDAVQAELGAHDVVVREALYVTATRYWSYTCPRPSCCPPGGRPVHDTATSPVAAAYVLEGRSPVGSREGLVARTAVRDPARAEQVGSAIAAELARLRPARRRPGSSEWLDWQRASLRSFDEVAARYVAGGAPVSEAETVRLLVALTDVVVRDVVAVRWTRWGLAMPAPPREISDPADAALARLTGSAHGTASQPPPDPAAEPVQHAVTRLLVDLGVSADGEPVLAALVLLAMQAWSCGDGAQAGVALDRALGIDDGYRLAQLVDALLRSGLAPGWVAPLREEDETPASDPAC
jgi:hypothetical protein